jgi:hypothetical protein
LRGSSGLQFKAPAYAGFKIALQKSFTGDCEVRFQRSVFLYATRLMGTDLHFSRVPLKNLQEKAGSGSNRDQIPYGGVPSLP